MEIKYGKFYENKTWKYLRPCLKGHGDLFLTHFNKTFKLATGVHDTLIDGAEISNNYSMYILFNGAVKIANTPFEDFLLWIRDQDYYVADYLYSTDLKNEKYIMVIIRVPKEYYISYEQFLKGAYSKMYSKPQIEKLFNPEEHKEILGVLLKTPEALEKYKQQLIEIYGNFNDKDFEPVEYDFPLVMDEEIFNYKKSNKVYFNPKVEKVWEQ